MPMPNPSSPGGLWDDHLQLVWSSLLVSKHPLVSCKCLPLLHLHQPLLQLHLEGLQHTYPSSDPPISLGACLSLLIGIWVFFSYSRTIWHGLLRVTPLQCLHILIDLCRLSLLLVLESVPFLVSLGFEHIPNLPPSMEAPLVDAPPKWWLLLVLLLKIKNKIEVSCPKLSY